MNPVRWRVEEFETIDSTNTWLKERALEGAEAGLCALAAYQSAGRGRLDRRWEAPPRSSLLTSILLRPTLDLSAAYLVTAAVALSARAALVRLSGLRPQLKWPNDLVVGTNKLGGVLAESVVGSDARRAYVVGIGVNLNWPGPPDLPATSVINVTGVTLEPRAVLDLLLEELDVRLMALDNDAGSSLRDELVASLSTLGQIVRVEMADKVINGTAVGLDSSGRLEVRTSNGTQFFAVGDITHLRTAPEGAL